MDGQTSDENSDVAPDDAFSMICGDLGLGENSRSSASLRYELEILSDSDLVKPERGKQEPLATFGKECSKDSELFDSKIRSSSFDECNTSTKTLNKLESGSNGSVSKRRPNSKSNSKLKSPKAGCEGNHCDTGTGSEFPSYADVPLGTSLRQQKKLYEQNLGSIIKKHRDKCFALCYFIVRDYLYQSLKENQTEDTSWPVNMKHVYQQELYKEKGFALCCFVAGHFMYYLRV